MNVGVTGAAGFLGGYVCGRLAEDGHAVRAMVRKTSRTTFLERLGVEIVVGEMGDVQTLKPFVDGCEAVIDAAVDFSICRSDPMAHFRVNLLGSLSVLELCRQGGARLVFISTGAVHSRILDDRPLDEAHPLWPDSTYGAYKAAVEAFLPAYRAQFGFNGCALRPTQIYGLHLTKPRKSHWYGLVRQVLAGESIETDRGGKIVHVEDVAEAAAAALRAEDVAGESFELTDCHIYDQTVAEFVREISGIDCEIADVKGTGPKNRIVSDKARTTLGVALNRGHEGVRAYVGQLVELLRKGG